MSKRQHLMIGIISALIAIGAACLLYWFQVRHMEMEEQMSVIVPKTFVDSGTRLTEEMLATKQIPKSAYHDDLIADKQEIIGLDTWIPLGEGEPILKWKLNLYHLFPAEGQATFQIPTDYICSVSNGIRAGDEVVLYISGGEEPSMRLFDESIVVASVRTGANQEVDHAEHSLAQAMADGNEQQLYAARREPNGHIEFINLNLTEEQWKQLDETCSSGERQLVIAYQSSFSSPSQDMKEGAS
ncbi:SAF domain-containing protein [Marinicrinis sediminis]|uniref:SAF domain-containing protein n=1 Tax=Marinicrinis sediminis TaxID=1652465 RepID=A0ABW5RC45_9BACL